MAVGGATYPRIRSASDSSILIEFGEGISESVNRAVYRFRDVVESSDLAEVVLETVPAYRTLLVEYDSLRLDDSEIRDRLEELAAGIVAESTDDDATDDDATDSSEPIEIPVVYGGEFGPDLGDVATHAGLSESEVVDIHTSAPYRVYMVGFAPGFPYLGGMDTRIACPRLTTPRLRLPAGSVGIAESQTGIYPNESAGGWRIIGRSPTVLFDVENDPPSVLEPGAMVSFVAVDSADFADDDSSS